MPEQRCSTLPLGCHQQKCRSRTMTRIKFRPRVVARGFTPRRTMTSKFLRLSHWSSISTSRYLRKIITINRFTKKKKEKVEEYLFLQTIFRDFPLISFIFYRIFNQWITIFLLFLIQCSSWILKLFHDDKIPVLIP